MKVVKIKGIEVKCQPKFLHEKKRRYNIGSVIHLLYYPPTSELPWHPHKIRKAIITNIVADSVCLKFIDPSCTYVHDGEVYEYPRRTTMDGKIFCKAVFAAIFDNMDPSDIFMCDYTIYEKDALVDKDEKFKYVGDIVLLSTKSSIIQVKISDINLSIKSGRVVVEFRQGNVFDYDDTVISKYYVVNMPCTVKKYHKLYPYTVIPNMYIR